MSVKCFGLWYKLFYYKMLHVNKTGYKSGRSFMCIYIFIPFPKCIFQRQNLYELFMFSIMDVGLTANTSLIITKAPHMDAAVK